MQTTARAVCAVCIDFLMVDTEVLLMTEYSIALFNLQKFTPVLVLQPRCVTWSQLSISA